jgi:hypothetical protein
MKTAAAVLVVTALWCAAVMASELPSTLTIEDETYENIRWGAVTPGSVTIHHRTGVATLPLEQLPEPLQKRFGYDPQKAAAWRAAQQQRVEQQRQVAEEQRARDAAAERERLRIQQELAARRPAAPPAPAGAGSPAAPGSSSGETTVMMTPRPSATVVMLRFFQVREIQQTGPGQYRGSVTIKGDVPVCVLVDEQGKNFLESARKQRAGWEQRGRKSGGGSEEKAKKETPPLKYQTHGFGPTITYGPVVRIRPAESQSQSANAEPEFIVYAMPAEGACLKLVGSHEAISAGMRTYRW